MQFQRLDGVDGPLGEVHGDFLQRLLPAGAGSVGPLGRRLSLLRRKNSCVSEAATAASCGCAGAADGGGRGPAPGRGPGAAGILPGSGDLPGSYGLWGQYFPGRKGAGAGGDGGVKQREADVCVRIS